jgi:hypothetical protein
MALQNIAPTPKQAATISGTTLDTSGAQIDPSTGQQLGNVVLTTQDPFQQAGWNGLSAADAKLKAAGITSDGRGGYIDSQGNPVSPDQVNNIVSVGGNGNPVTDTISDTSKDVLTPVVNTAAPAIKAVDPNLPNSTGLPGSPSMGGGSVGNLDLTSLNAQIAAAAALRDQNNQASLNYQPGTAPTVTAAQAQAALAAQGAPIQAGTYAGAQLGPVAAAQAAQVAPAVQALGQAPLSAQQIQAAQAGRTQIGPTTLSDAAQLNLANADQTRAQQQGLVSSLQGTIAGTNPSVAAIMLRQETERNIANQYALAQGASGMNTGLAERQAMINAADANQQSIGQKALLRAQEISQAQGLLGQNLGTIGGQDIGIASTQAGYRQQTGLANQAAQNTSTVTQAQLDAAQQALNVGAQNTIAQANQGANLQAGTTNATLAQQIALANAAAQNTQAAQQASLAQGANLQNATEANAANLAQGQLTNQAGISNAGNVTGANTASAQLANQVNLANAAAQTGVSQTNTAATNQVGLANQGAAMTQEQIDKTAQQNLAQNALQGAATSTTGAAAATNAQTELAKAQAIKDAAVIGGVSAGVAKLL